MTASTARTIPGSAAPQERDAAAPLPPGRKARIRLQLTAAALDLFEEQGFDATTVAQIAESAGVTRRTFFNHFATKVEVLFPKGGTTLQSLITAVGERSIEESDYVALRECGLDWLSDHGDLDLDLHRRLGSIRARAFDSLVVLGKSVEFMAEFSGVLTTAVAYRHDRTVPVIRDRVLGNAAAWTLRLAFESWLESSDEDLRGLRRIVTEHFDELREAIEDARSS